MKKEYVKPESKFVDITLNESLLEGPAISDVDEEANRGLWDDNYDRLPSGKSVWDDESIKEEE